MRYVRRYWLGLALTGLALVLPLAVTALAGPIFGRWEWPELAVALLVVAALALVLLSGFDGDRNPYYRVVPSLHVPGLDPQVLYGGIRVEQPERARRGINRRLASQALPPAIVAGLLLLFLI